MTEHDHRREQVISMLLNEIERAALEGEDDHLQAVTEAYAVVTEGVVIAQAITEAERRIEAEAEGQATEDAASAGTILS